MLGVTLGQQAIRYLTFLEMQQIFNLQIFIVEMSLLITTYATHIIKLRKIKLLSLSLERKRVNRLNLLILTKS